MYTEAQLISFASYVLNNSLESGESLAVQLENWKWENNLPIIDEGTDFYEHPCIVKTDSRTLKGNVIGQHPASGKFAYDVSVNYEYHSGRLFNVPCGDVIMLDLPAYPFKGQQRGMAPQEDSTGK